MKTQFPEAWIIRPQRVNLSNFVVGHLNQRITMFLHLLTSPCLWICCVCSCNHCCMLTYFVVLLMIGVVLSKRCSYPYVLDMSFSPFCRLLFIKIEDVLPRNLAKSRSHNMYIYIYIYVFSVVLKFDRRFGSRSTWQISERYGEFNAWYIARSNDKMCYNLVNRGVAVL